MSRVVYPKKNRDFDVPEGYVLLEQDYYRDLRNGKNGGSSYNKKKDDEDYKKRSGAKYLQGVGKNGVEYRGVSAWFYSKDAGFVTVKGFYSEEKSKEFFHEETGALNAITIPFVVFYKSSGIKHVVWALYRLDTGKAFLQDLNIIVSTKAKDGGYAGYYRPKPEGKK